MHQQLPRIHDRSIQQIENPFYIPDDYDIYKLKEKSKQIRSEERFKFNELKIQEKSLKNLKQSGLLTQRSIRKIGSEESSFENDSKIKFVKAADMAVKNRVKSREPMHKFLQQKKDMLIVSMLEDQKRSMIDEFENLTRLHQKGLDQSLQYIDEDLDLFNKFLEANKNSTRDAIKDAEKETKLKQEKTNEMKILHEQRTDLQAKNQQKIDNLEDLIKYKKFLDKVTPKEYQKQKQLLENEYQLNKEFQLLELQQIIDDSDDDLNCYFKEPQQLMDIFLQLEERNLFLMANTKEREQMVEELRSKVIEKKKQLEDKQKNAVQTKFELEKQITQVNEQIRIFKNIKSDNDAFESLKNLESMISRMYRADINPEPRKDLSGLEMLKETEIKLEQYILILKKLRKQKPEQILDQEKACIRLKKEKLKQEKQEQDLIEQQRKQKEQQRVVVIQKRNGRPIMIRSWPPKEEIEEQIIADISEEEKEWLKYFT